MKAFVTFVLALIAIVISLVALKYFTSPYVWINSIWLITLILAAILTRRSSIKALYINLAVIVLTLGVIEIYLSIQDKSDDGTERYEGSYTKQYFKRDIDIIGYGPIGGVSADVKKYKEDKLIYDVIYTIDSNGLRIAPPYNYENDSPCILFFGGSFTFGEGVNDDEAMPYRVGTYSNGEYRTYNFGFHGYGPHQMLSALEHGLVESIIDCSPRYVFYQAIPDHIHRASGSINRQHTPKYIVKKNGSVEFAGYFENDFSFFIKKQLRKSKVYKRIEFAIPKEDEFKLYAGVVAGARDYVKHTYPDAEFHVLLWTYPDEKSKKVYDSLQKNNITVHFVRGILQSSVDENENQEKFNVYDSNDLLNISEIDFLEKYIISPFDHHPNALAHDIIARYVFNNIITNDNAKN